MKDKLIELRLSTGMKRGEFAEYFGIPYRTLQSVNVWMILFTGNLM